MPVARTRKSEPGRRDDAEAVGGWNASAMEDTTLIVRKKIVGRVSVEIWQMLRGRSPRQHCRKSSPKKLVEDLDCPDRIEAANVVTVRRGCSIVSF